MPRNKIIGRVGRYYITVSPDPIMPDLMRCCPNKCCKFSLVFFAVVLFTVHMWKITSALREPGLDDQVKELVTYIKVEEQENIQVYTHFIILNLFVYFSI